ncbi:hypothetical protein ESOMN_v1c02040 [Williamsoniiplasma somnilux]|uniref:RDD domain-containing protein n=1 Tax=Williamsoniiplasma somnilux TaxID=215578 RepID=A0A2K8NZE5_9MOLU|nr:hypothetical protein ESOMN_v1c02040 [Williamsoniiplasma somnilux]
MLLIAVLDLIALVLIISLSKHSFMTVDGSIARINRVWVEGLSILGWFLCLTIYFWWYNLTISKGEELIKLVEKYLSLEELKLLKHYFKVWRLIPFSSRIII